MARTKQAATKRVDLNNSQQRREFTNRAARKSAIKVVKKTVKPNIVARTKELKKINSVDLMIPKRPFKNLVKEISQNFVADLRFQKEALLALQEAAEAYLVQLFQDGNKVANHCKRVTLKSSDLKLVLNLRGEQVGDGNQELEESKFM